MVKDLGKQALGLVTEKKGSFSLIDAGLIAVGKSVVVDGYVSPMLNKVTGGKPLFNVIAKAVVAGLTGSMIKGRAGNVIATSMIISAGDELATSLFGIGAKQPAGEARAPAGADTYGQSNRGEGIVRFI